MVEGQSRVCGLVGRRGRCHGRVFHISCPLFARVEGWLSSRGMYRLVEPCSFLVVSVDSSSFRMAYSHESYIRSMSSSVKCYMCFKAQPAGDRHLPPVPDMEGIPNCATRDGPQNSMIQISQFQTPIFFSSIYKNIKVLSLKLQEVVGIGALSSWRALALAWRQWS